MRDSDEFKAEIIREKLTAKGMQPERELVERLAALAAAEERMRSVVTHVLDGIISIDDQRIIATFNPAAEKIFGYKASEVIGRNVKVLMPAPYHDEHDGYIANYLRTGQAKIIGTGREVVGRRKDGTIFPMDLAISEIRLGKARHFTGIVRDITERKRVEGVLRQREEFARRLIESSQDCITVLDLEGRLLSMNRGGQLLLEIADLTPMLNQSWIDLWEDADRDTVREAMAQAVAGGVGRFESYHPTTTGKPKWCDVVISPVCGNDDRVEWLIAICRDVTERMQSVANIRMLYEELEQRVVERARELQEALDDVRRLQEMLPICAWCKKVRDDENYWHMVESYIMAHSEVRFTQGKCPDCLKLNQKAHEQGQQPSGSSS